MKKVISFQWKPKWFIYSVAERSPQKENVMILISKRSIYFDELKTWSSDEREKRKATKKVVEKIKTIGNESSQSKK